MNWFAPLATTGALAGALVYAALAFWVLFPLATISRTRALLALALATTAIWLGVMGYAAFAPVPVLAAENLRNAAWLLFMYRLLANASPGGDERGLAWVYGSLAFVAFLGGVGDAWVALSNGAGAEASNGRLILQTLLAIGALVLAHNLYSVASSETRANVAAFMAALAALWTYDLNLYTISYLSAKPALQLIALRPILTLILAPVFVVAILQKPETVLRLSRSATFQTLSLLAIGTYLVVMATLAAVLRSMGGDYGMLAQTAVLIVGIAGLVVILPSARLRARLRVAISKHFFQHRYDYRAEWLRFAQTVGRPGDEQHPVQRRIIQAVADIIEAPGGLLYLPDEEGGLALAADWNHGAGAVDRLGVEVADYLAQSGRILDFVTLRSAGPADVERALLPPDFVADSRLWAGVPLIHFDRLVGLLLVAPPRIARRLDWEDLDMLRIVGLQSASYLAESIGQEALAEARRFEEFNRRFAFIIHDIKNVVSQLSLVARNVERHADNPAFRADMMNTLQHSVQRMNDLLAKLSQHNRTRIDPPQPVALGPWLENFAGRHPGKAAIEVTAPLPVVARVDPTRLEIILDHLVQNALDASAAGTHVTLAARGEGGRALIDVRDCGHGMSPEFIRSQLFKPFASTKPAGFGVGAFEARTLAQAMGGTIRVRSREGEGTVFTVVLPLGGQANDSISPLKEAI